MTSTTRSTTRINRDTVRKFEAMARAGTHQVAEVSDSDITGFKMTLSAAGSITFLYRLVLPSGKRTTLTLGKVSQGMTAEQAREVARAHANTTARKGDKPVDVERKARLLASYREAVHAAVTLEGFIDDTFGPWYIQDNPMAPGRARHVRDLKVKFADLMPLRMQDVTGTMLMDWRAARSATRTKDGFVAPSTVNRELSVLCAVFSKAMEAKVIVRHPMWDVEKDKRKLDERALARTHYLTPAEEVRLRDALAARDASFKRDYARVSIDPRQCFIFPPEATYADYVQPVILLVLNTGMRLQEAMKLTWDRVNFSTARGNGEVIVEAHGNKGVITRGIPLNDEAAEVLKAWKAQCAKYLPVQSRLVFGNDLGQQRRTISGHVWRNLLQAAAIEDFQFRDLRRSFATHAFQQGADGLTVMKWMGHTNIRTTETYIVDQNEHEQIKALNRARAHHANVGRAASSKAA
jgi:integrase